MTPAAGSEIERRYEVAEATSFPALDAVTAIRSVDDSAEVELESVYFDTAGLALADRRMTLRRRTGGREPGWKLTLPVAPVEGRELVKPLGADPDRIPKTIQAEVRAAVRGRELVPVARLHSGRTVRRLRGAEGRLLAVVVDDRVHAERLQPEATRLDWREWKIDLVAADEALLDAMHPLLVGAGARESLHASDLAHVLGDRVPVHGLDVPAAVGRQASTAAVLLDYMGEQVRMLEVHDPLLRRDQPDAVHQMRVACRRLRSVLATYRSLLDAERARWIRAELRWLAGALGASRDVEVIEDRLTDRLSREPSDLVVGPIARRIASELGSDFRTARKAGLAAVDSARYFRLLDTLDDFLAAPPLADEAATAARRIVPRLIRAERKKLTRLVAAAQATPPESPARDSALHEVRKRAKRLRCAAETALPVRPKSSRRLADAAEEIQTVLGDHQDSVVARQVLLRLAAAARRHGESGFSYGRLHALEQSAAVASEARFRRAWTSLAEPELAE